MNTEDRAILNAESANGTELTFSPLNEQQNTTNGQEVESQLGVTDSSLFASSTSAEPSLDGPQHRFPLSLVRTISATRDRNGSNGLNRQPTAVEQIDAYQLQHSLTVGSIHSRSAARTASRVLPPFGGGKPYPPQLPEREQYVVDFNGPDDPCHPRNWRMKTKLIISAILVFDSFAATFASAIFSPASKAIESQFNIGREVATLGTSLYVLGYAFGPIVWAPMSELYGRRLPTIIAAFGFGLFEIAVATGHDPATLVICRLFSGTFGSCAFVVCPALFADVFDNKVRGLAVAAFAGTIFIGPLLAPLVGGFIAKSYLGWRWTQYIPAFMAFAACILALFFQKESYGPVILVNKAAELRRLTHNWGIHSKQEEVEVDLKDLVVKNVGRPLRMLFTEPLILFITIYMSFLYGILYLSLTAFSIVFTDVYGFSLGVEGLPYFGVILGVCISLILTVVLNGGYVKKLEANNNVQVPEWRLPPAMIGSIFFAIGLFWFGWTGFTSDIHWSVPTTAGLALGFGIFSVFLSLLVVIIDSYLAFAASAVAANTFLRSIAGATFPLFGYYMFTGIGIQWGMTLLGCLATIMIPMPFLLYIYGPRIRAKSKFAPVANMEQVKLQTMDEESRGDFERKID